MTMEPYVRFWIEEKLADGRWAGPVNGHGQGYSYPTREQAESEAKRIFTWATLGEDLRVVRIES